MIIAVDLKNKLNLGLVELAILDFVNKIGMGKYSNKMIGEVLGISPSLVSSGIKTILSIRPELMMFNDGEYFVTGHYKDMLIDRLNGEDFKTDISELTEQVIAIYNKLTDSRAEPTAWEETIGGLVKQSKKKWGKPLELKHFEAVIRHKHSEWSGTEMEKHLRPITLFRGGKFFKYLSDAKSWYLKTK